MLCCRQRLLHLTDDHFPYWQASPLSVVSEGTRQLAKIPRHRKKTATHPCQAIGV
jgi:hypothetical protein